MLRRVRSSLVLALPLAVALAWSPDARANLDNLAPSVEPVEELRHEAALSIEREGATLVVTRELHNHGTFHAQVDISIELPCGASLDDVEVLERGADGTERWRPAELLAAEQASHRWYEWIGASNEDEDEDGDEDEDADADARTNAHDADTAVHVTRSDYRCAAELAIYPVPPALSRVVSYRVFVPSSYAEGRYTIELPSFGDDGKTATLELASTSALESDFDLQIDDAKRGPEHATLDGGSDHRIVLEPRDAGRARLSASDLDLDALLATHASAPAEAPAGHLLTADFDAPSELAQLPPVRRVVVVVDASRSFHTSDRNDLRAAAAAYLGELARQADVGTAIRGEILLFDRKPRRVYQDFVPVDWLAADLPKLDVDVQNGSELGEAIAGARELLDAPTTLDGADWIVVISDYDLRSDFSIAAEVDAAAGARPRMHMLRNDHDRSGFWPAPAAAPWTAVARSAGGMLWDVSARQFDEAALGRELVQPTRIWSLQLALELDDGARVERELADFHAAGELHHFVDYAHAGAGLSRASFVGEVWGQARAWSVTPDDHSGLRVAAALATEDPDGALSEATRTALGFHAQVVSPFTSAWAVASYEGAPAAPRTGIGIGGFGSSGGYGTGCGGAFGRRRALPPSGPSLATLAQQALAQCPRTPDGSFSFETTDNEIVDVDGAGRCLSEAVWALDITPTRLEGHKRVHVEHEGGRVTTTKIAKI